MYYPFLRARQFELISIRELVSDQTLQGKVFPVLEPIKEEVNNLNLAHGIFQAHDFSTFLIVNPQVGRKNGDSLFFLNYMRDLDNCKFIHAFVYTDNNEYITTAIKTYGISKCMIIGMETFSNEEGFKQCCNLHQVTHIALLDPGKYRVIDRFIKGLGKNYVRFDDLFEKQQKNADFLQIPAHKFSEEHLYYDSEGYQGFADFTVLPSEFIDGGSTPRAVVIHLTYLNREEGNQIWIRHFTSESNDGIANVQGKFAQAAGKAIDFCDQHGLTNSAIEELRGYLRDKKYPGLGTVKKISIKNHLVLVSSLLP